MALGTFIGGRYSSTLGGVDIGLTKTGYQLVAIPKGEMINQSDAYAQSLLDFFYAGLDVNMVLDGLEYKTGTINAIWPWGTIGYMGIIARLASDLASQIILVSTAGTPAENTPASMTANLAIIAPNSNIELVFSSRLRNVPIRFHLLPNDVDGAGTIAWFQNF